MPGGYALFVGGKIFANVTVDGRIGVKLTVAWCLEELAAMPGASPWLLGKKPMEGWVLLPESLNASDVAVREWVERAHACATGKMPLRKMDFDHPPPTARSHDDRNGAAYERARAPHKPPTITETPPLPAAARRRSLVPAPPSSRSGANGGVDLSSYAPPPPSSVGIRVVPRDSKSPYEETLVGVPAPPSSRIDLEDDD